MLLHGIMQQGLYLSVPKSNFTNIHWNPRNPKFTRTTAVTNKGVAMLSFTLVTICPPLTMPVFCQLSIRHYQCLPLYSVAYGTVEFSGLQRNAEW